MSEPFIKRMWQKPPIVFPLVALFHVFMLGYYIWVYSTEPFPSIGWVQPLWWLLYTVSWLFVCDMKLWAALVYIGLTTLNLTLRYTLSSPTDIDHFTDAAFPADVLFTFFLMFYYKSFKK